MPFDPLTYLQEKELDLEQPATPEPIVPTVPTPEPVILPPQIEIEPFDPLSYLEEKEAEEEITELETTLPGISEAPVVSTPEAETDVPLTPPEALASTTAVAPEYTETEKVMAESEGQIPGGQIPKALAIGTTGLAQAAAYSADYMARQRRIPRVAEKVAPKPIAMEFGSFKMDPKETAAEIRRKSWDEMNEGERKKVLTPTKFKNLAKSIDASVPEKWKEDVGKVTGQSLGLKRLKSDPVGWLNTAVTQAANTAPLIAQQAVATVVGNAVLPGFGGAVGGGSAMIMEEMGRFLETGDVMGKNLKGEEKYKWEQIIDSYAPGFGFASGMTEYAGNAAGVLGAFKKQGQSTMLKQLLKRVAGVVGEGVEELSQEQLMNVIMGKAIEDMRKDNPDFAKDWQPGDLKESFISGVVIGGIFGGAGVITRKGMEKVAEEKEAPPSVSTLAPDVPPTVPTAGVFDPEAYLAEKEKVEEPVLSKEEVVELETGKRPKKRPVEAAPETTPDKVAQEIKDETGVPETKKIKKILERRQGERVTLEELEKPYREELPDLTDEQYAKMAEINDRHGLSKVQGKASYNSAIAEARKNLPEGSVLLEYSGDIDRFKMFNDNLGHDFGDDILTETQKELYLRAGSDGIEHYHFSGDEAGGWLVIEKSKVSEGIDRIASLQAAMNEHEVTAPDGTDVKVGMTIGISSEGFKKADQLLKKGKSEVGRNSILVDDVLKSEYNIEDRVGIDHSAEYEKHGFTETREEADEKVSPTPSDKKKDEGQVLPEGETGRGPTAGKPSKPEVVEKKPAEPEKVTGKSEAAGQEVQTEPSEAQKEAGNYKKAHVRRDGFDISIENPVGSERSGTDTSGKKWTQKMHADYGYIKGSVGYDKDHVDVFIKPGSEGGGTVYVVNQVDPGTKQFDEHKAMMGYASEEDASKGYLSNYEQGWQGEGSIVAMEMDAFKEWAMSEAPKKGAIPIKAAKPTLGYKSNIVTAYDAMSDVSRYGKITFSEEFKKLSSEKQYKAISAEKRAINEQIAENKKKGVAKDVLALQLLDKSLSKKQKVYGVSKAKTAEAIKTQMSRYAETGKPDTVLTKQVHSDIKIAIEEISSRAISITELNNILTINYSKKALQTAIDAIRKGNKDGTAAMDIRKQIGGYLAEGVNPDQVADMLEEDEVPFRKDIDDLETGLKKLAKKKTPKLFDNLDIKIVDEVEIGKKKHKLGRKEKGLIYPEKEKYNIRISSELTPEEAAITLFHELAHGSAANIFRSNQKIHKRLTAIYKSQQASELVRKIRDKYDGTDTQFNEFIAFSVEKQMANPKKRGAYYYVTQAVREFFIKMGWKKDTVDDVIDAFVKEMRKAEPGAELITKPMKMMELYHGTPHKIDKFATDRIGTGEGSQTFGWGLYFTDSKDVAEYYTDLQGVTEPRQYVDGKRIPKKNILESVADDIRMNGYVQAGIHAKYRGKEFADAHQKLKGKKITQKWDKVYEDGNLYKATVHKGKKTGEYDYMNWRELPTSAQINKIKRQAAKEKISIGGTVGVIKPNLQSKYALPEVLKAGKQTGYAMDDILMSIENDGDAYRALMEKHPELESNEDWAEEVVRSVWGRTTSEKALSKIVLGEVRSTEELYQKLSALLKTDKEASLFLLRSGIDGIKYTSGMLSGIKDSQSTNYVVFDESAIEKPEQTLFSKEIEEALSKRGVKGDDLLNEMDKLAEIKEGKGVVNNDAYVTLYHRTNKKSADEIVKLKKMTSKEDGLFFSTRPTGQAEGYGDVVVKVSLPMEKVEVNDIFAEETHLRYPTKSIGKLIPVGKAEITKETEPSILMQKDIDVDHVKKLEKEVRSIKAKLRHFSEDFILQRAHLGIVIRDLKAESTEMVRNLVYDYAKKIGLRSEVRNRVDTLIKNSKTAKNFEKAMTIMDETLEKRQSHVMMRAVRAKILKEKQRLKKLAGKGKSAQTYEANKRLKEYIEDLEYIPANRLATLEKTAQYFQDNPDQEMPDSVKKDILMLAKKNIREMDTRQLTQILRDIGQIKKYGKLKYELQRIQKERGIKKLAAIATTQVEKTTKESAKGALQEAVGKGKKSRIRSLANLGKKYGWSHIRPERILEWFTGFKKSPLHSQVFDKALKAEKTQLENTENTFNKFQDINKDVNMAEAVNKPYMKFDSVDGSIELTLDQMMFIYANSQNPGNMAHLTGTGIDVGLIAEVEANLPESYKKVVDDTIDYYDTVQYERINEVFKKEHNVDMPQEHRYFPIMNLKTDRAESTVMNDLIARYSARQGSVQKGMTKSRVQSKAAYRSLSFYDSVIRNFQSSEHYIAYNDAVREINQFLNNPELKAAMEDKSGQATAQIKDWVKAIAYGKTRTTDQAIDKVSDWMRTNYMTAVLGLNLVTMMKQPASFAQGLAQVKKPQAVVTSAKFITNPFKMIKFVNEKSTMMRNRGTSYERELAEMAEKGFVSKQLKQSQKVLEKIKDVKGWYGNLKEFSMKGITAADKATTTILWYTKYSDVLNATGNESAAIKQADRVIRRTQPMGGIVHLPQIYRGGGIARAYTMFTNQLNQNLNLMFELQQTWGEKKNKDRVAETVFYTIIPSMLIYMASHGGRLPWEDPEGWASAFVQNITGGLMLANKLLESGMLYAMGKVKEMRGGFPSNKSRIGYAVNFAPTSFGALEDLGMGIGYGKPEKVFDATMKFAGLPYTAVRKAWKGSSAAIANKNPKYLIWSKTALKSPLIKDQMITRLKKKTMSLEEKKQVFEYFRRIDPKTALDIQKKVPDMDDKVQKIVDYIFGDPIEKKFQKLQTSFEKDEVTEEDYKEKAKKLRKDQEKFDKWMRTVG